jgi:2-amino-4-hydroxy-6-hydroxymethyldihydropteridine diphosphokinase
MSDERGADLNASPAYLSVGSNVGKREIAVLGVPRLIEALGAGRRARISSLYETEPIGCAPMGIFINAVVEFEPLLCPWDLLKRLQAIEKQVGRRGGHNEPRELDIDIVTLGASVIQSEVLTVPHPAYRDRAFVMIPLKEIAPRFTCPATGRCIDDLISSLSGDQRVVKVSSRKTVLA